MAAKRDLTIYAGDTYLHEVTIKDSNNNPINISGNVYSAQARKSYASGDPVITFTTAITDAANGVMQMSLTANQTSNLKAGSYVYDLQETKGATVLTLLHGDLTVVGGVTRA